MAPSTPPPHAFPTVQGHCPACGATSLFLAAGGYVTCSRIGCPEPDAASTLLERRPTPENLPGGCMRWLLRIPHDAHTLTFHGRPVPCPGYGEDDGTRPQPPSDEPDTGLGEIRATAPRGPQPADQGPPCVCDCHQTTARETP